jgi:FkbM family methyltransferase
MAWFKDKLRSSFGFAQRALLGYEPSVYSFSQAGEDIQVRNYFYERLTKNTGGTYVDIGAYHPYLLSNTYYLYRCGWRGINIDPRPGSKALFDRFRPDDVNLELAVSSEDGNVEYFFSNESPTLNTIKQEHIERLGMSSKFVGTISIPTRRLDSILAEHFPNDFKIDFLTLDVEGGEMEVLNSLDWGLYSFGLIAVEVLGESLDEIKANPVSRYLSELGYVLFTRNILATPGVNTVFFQGPGGKLQD